MPLLAARLEGEVMGVLAGEFVVVRVVGRAVELSLGEVLGFLVRVGAISVYERVGELVRSSWEMRCRGGGA